MTRADMVVVGLAIVVAAAFMILGMYCPELL
jgi:hypothetical protein